MSVGVGVCLVFLQPFWACDLEFQGFYLLISPTSCTICGSDKKRSNAFCWGLGGLLL